MKKLLKIFYIKWILGQCKHFCVLCKYRNDCYDNLEYEYDKIKGSDYNKS